MIAAVFSPEITVNIRFWVMREKIFQLQSLPAENISRDEEKIKHYIRWRKMKNVLLVGLH